MPTRWNGSVFRKGPTLYICIKIHGKWKSIATPYRPGQESEAEQFLRETRRRVLAAEAVGATVGSVTVADYAKIWVERRRARGDKWDVDNDAGRLRKHILPKIGSKRLVDVLPADIRAVVDAASASGRAFRTVRNVYSTIRMLFNEATVDGLLQPRDNPCILTRAHLPPNRDKNPRWRATAVFERSEIAVFLQDARVPDDRHVYYAMLYFTGMRLGEVSGLRIEDYDPNVVPLARLLVSRSYNRDWTKTGVERVVPVHPELKCILDKWIASGWQAFMGRPPRATDILVPTAFSAAQSVVCRDGKRRGAKFVPGGIVRNKKYVRTWFLRDLEVLKLRHRRLHDFRRSMVSHALSDGADRDIIERISHQGARDVLGLYTTFEWQALCTELGKLRSTRKQVTAKRRRVSKRESHH